MKEPVRHKSGQNTTYCCGPQTSIPKCRINNASLVKFWLDNYLHSLWKKHSAGSATPVHSNNQLKYSSPDWHQNM